MSKQVISTNQAPAAIGPYSQAIVAGNMLITSGQLGLDPVSGQFVGETVAEQTEQVFKNLKAILDEAGFTFGDIIKTTCFLADMNDFGAMNEVYQKHFSGSFPARSAVAVKTLPKNGLIEIEAIAVR